MKIAVTGATPTELARLTELLSTYTLVPVAGPLSALTEKEQIEGLCVFVQDTIDAPTIASFSKLRLIATRSTGYDHIDLAAATAAKITVCNVPNYGETTVAEFTMALVLALSRKLHTAYANSLRGEFSLDGLRGSDLAGKTVGIVGAGRIGRHVAQMALGFGTTVIASDPKPNPEEAQRIGFTYVGFEELLARADIVIINAPLTPSTQHLFDAETLGRLKPSAFLVNTGRGGLVHTEALLAALDSGKLRGAALDVLEEEKSLATIGAALLQDRPNLILTPHMAFDSDEAVGRILSITAENIEAFVRGEAINMVA